MTNWQKNNFGAYVLKLGTLEKAIIIVRSFQPLEEAKWRISISSFLPFTDEQYQSAFLNPEECAKYAESIVLEWLKSLIINIPHPMEGTLTIKNDKSPSRKII